MDLYPRSRGYSLSKVTLSGVSRQASRRNTSMHTYELERENEHMYIRLKRILIRPLKLPPSPGKKSLNFLSRKRERQRVEEENCVIPTQRLLQRLQRSKPVLSFTPDLPRPSLRTYRPGSCQDPAPMMLFKLPTEEMDYRFCYE